MWSAAALALVAAVLVLTGLDGSKDDDRAVAPAAPGQGERPVAARAFADSIGVNVHLTYTSTPYGSFDRVLSALRDLGVRHIRDGLVPNRPDQEDRLNRLADAGIRATLIMGAPNVGSLADELATAKRNARVLDALEGPNEYDVAGDSDWAASLLRYQRDLYKQAKADPTLRRLPVYGPTVAMARNLPFLGSLRGAMDVPNIHPYPGGGPPEGALEDNRAALERATRMDGAVATETGYHNARGGDQDHPGVDEAVAADYLPRLFLTAYADGYRRTFWYELVDVGEDPAKPDSNFGLLRADFQPKPAYEALRNLIRLTDGASGGDAQLQPLRFSVSGGDDVRRLLLEKPDGSYLLALWRAADLGGDARRSLDADPTRLRVELPRAARAVAVYRPSRSADPVAQRRDVSSIPVSLAGDAVVVQIEPSGP